MNVHLLKIRAFICILIVAFLSCGRPVSAGIPSPLDESTSAVHYSALKSEILRLINDYRKENGKSALQYEPLLEEVADDHSERMASGQLSFGHDGFEDRNSRLKKHINGMNAMAENVAFGKLSATRVVELWLKSSGHRKNIEGDYTITGIGIAKAPNGQLYFTQIFVRR